jgi:penicillin-binding protein 1A
MKKSTVSVSKETQKKFIISFWIIMLLPFLLVSSLLLFQPESNLPTVAFLDNPPDSQASAVFAKNNNKEDTIIGRFWLINRTSIRYKDISPYVIDALIATEDERFMEHSGVDFRAIARSISGLGTSGGASTLTQQLSKLLFTLEDRKNKDESNNFKFFRGPFLGKFVRLNEKARENIISKRLEERYTKEEIITMYLNQFDFLYNAVGIENAAKIYFDKTAKKLSKNEAAMLVGMCKNPNRFNPYTYQIKNYRRYYALKENIPQENVTLEQIRDLRNRDSLLALGRRNQVLFQWQKNSVSNNLAIKNKIDYQEFQALKSMPITTRYKSLDHKDGMAPYFRQSLSNEVKELLQSKNKSGNLVYQNKNGEAYDIYRDGLKIYTTINTSLQRHAEYAVEHYIKNELQPAFDKNNNNLNNYPFPNSIGPDMINRIMQNARQSTERYRLLKISGASQSEIIKNFEAPVPMKVFSWKGEFDTIMSPNDSIRYYKAYLHAGLISIDPSTGFVKAWVGGVDFKHFAYDHVRLGKRQVGSTIKPFIYATALSMKSVTPCTRLTSDENCVITVNNNNEIIGRWRPSGSGAGSVYNGLAQSSNPTTAGVLGSMGYYNKEKKIGGPFQVYKVLRKAGILLEDRDINPTMCLGSMDISLFDLVAAQCIFPNNGIYTRPTTIERITDRNGKVIYSAFEEREQVINSTVAFEIIKMLKGVIQIGTGTGLKSAKFGNIHPPTAGKTGTTQNNSDGWFIGITPNLVTGIWVGAEDRAIRFRSMTYGQGARMALPIYGYYMEKVYKDPKIALSRLDFMRPADYDSLSYDCIEIQTPEQYRLNQQQKTLFNDSLVPFIF